VAIVSAALVKAADLPEGSPTATAGPSTSPPGHRFLSVLTIPTRLPISSDHFSAGFVPVCLVKTDRKTKTCRRPTLNSRNNSKKWPRPIRLPVIRAAAWRSGRGVPGAAVGFDWQHFSMETVVDRAGRIVLPKYIRDALGLLPGTKVDISL
jgi:AbrB family looped-hinge helix DNA binding protein